MVIQFDAVQNLKNQNVIRRTKTCYIWQIKETLRSLTSLFNTVQIIFIPTFSKVKEYFNNIEQIQEIT